MKPVLLLLVLSTTALVSTQSANAGRALLLISIDGLRPDYVLEADRHGLRIPNLRALVRNGASATRVRGVLPTATYPSHTTIITGVTPAKHGIVGNQAFRARGEGSRCVVFLRRRYPHADAMGRRHAGRLCCRQCVLARDGRSHGDPLQHPGIQPHAHRRGRQDHARCCHARLDDRAGGKGRHLHDRCHRLDRTRLGAHALCR